MQRKSFGSMTCPIARSLERVGEWWSILILRDAFRGLTRFDQFQKSLDIAPNMLTRRLNALVEAGLLERRVYSEHPPRHEYVLTERGRDFRPVLWTLLAWGNRHFAPEGPGVVLADAQTGITADPALIDRISGQVIARDVVRPATTARRRWLSSHVAFAVLGLAALTASRSYGHDWWTVGRFVESTDDAYVGGNVTPIAPHVAGFVKEILVTDHQYVKAG